MKKNIETVEIETVEHVITVIGCFLDSIDDVESKKDKRMHFNRACKYLKEWVKYRMPKNLKYSKIHNNNCERCSVCGSHRHSDTPLSACNSCNCMTKTIKGNCGKCGTIKLTNVNL